MQLQTTKTVFTVSQFLDWQRSGVLVLQPVFQRRHVWKPAAKSQLLASAFNGYPVPIVFLRQVQDLKTLSMRMEVVDGQQRIRTLLGFIEPQCLKDFDPKRDAFTVRTAHNEDLAGKSFSQLSDSQKQAILGYELSTHVFPATTSDDLIYRIFALLNSTGLKLTAQEIRNAEFHGAFKSLVYDLSFEYIGEWRNWRVFNDDAISRMDEAEAVSEYIMAMLQGIAGKRQSNISKFYDAREDEFEGSKFVRRRFEATLEAINASLGNVLSNSAFNRPALFYSLFVAIYSHMYGLESPLKKVTPESLPDDIATRLVTVSARIRKKELPEKVQDAMDKATGDKARRQVRHNFLVKALGLEPIG